jgi:hypothetical protein
VECPENQAVFHRGRIEILQTLPTEAHGHTALGSTIGGSSLRDIRRHTIAAWEHNISPCRRIWTPAS